MLQEAGEHAGSVHQEPNTEGMAAVEANKTTDVTAMREVQPNDSYALQSKVATESAD